MFCCYKLCSNSNRLIYDKSAPRIYDKSTSYQECGPLSQKVFISLPFSLSHVLAIIISYIPFESLKSQNSSCENHFEIGHCVTIEMVLQNVLAVSSPLAGVSYYKMYYGLLESKLFIILTKYISLERSESQD